MRALRRVGYVVLMAAAAVVALSAQAGAPAAGIFVRRYVEGQRLVYHMTGVNNGRTYEVRVVSTVRRGSDARLGEEYAFEAIDAARPLSPAEQAFRIAMTLDGNVPFTPPNLSQVRGIVGPITDMMTFWADLFIAARVGVQKAGDHVRVPSPATGSWADGTVVILGEDSIDFDITLSAVDTAAGEARLLVRHVPPASPKIHLPAEWMQTPVADTPNNWVQVEKTANGYNASVGKETFDVTLVISLSDGRVLSAAIDNPVTATARTCSDAALTQCGPPRPDPTLRHIELAPESR